MTDHEMSETGQLEDPVDQEVVDDAITGSGTTDIGGSSNSDEATANGQLANASSDEEPETFPRDYVEKLRDENAKYRQRAADRDQVAERLHTALVAATGRLHDPTDLPFDNDHLDDADALTAAIDALIDAKPHLANRKPSGDIGQGPSQVADTFTLTGALNANAR